VDQEGASPLDEGAVETLHIAVLLVMVGSGGVVEDAVDVEVLLQRGVGELGAVVGLEDPQRMAKLTLEQGKEANEEARDVVLAGSKADKGGAGVVVQEGEEIAFAV
jgi:hypothetical protein